MRTRRAPQRHRFDIVTSGFYAEGFSHWDPRVACTASIVRHVLCHTLEVFGSDDVNIMADGWNHNTHYHVRLLQAVPCPCGRALDVGCRLGGFARRLASRRRVDQSGARSRIRSAATIA